jgi:DNA-directed RNA polymerase subunit RPC12/RpoP
MDEDPMVKCFKCGEKFLFSEFDQDEFTDSYFITCPRCGAKLTDDDWISSVDLGWEGKR